MSSQKLSRWEQIMILIATLLPVVLPIVRNVVNNSKEETLTWNFHTSQWESHPEFGDSFSKPE